MTHVVLNDILCALYRERGIQWIHFHFLFDLTGQSKHSYEPQNENDDDWLLEPEDKWTYVVFHDIVNSAFTLKMIAARIYITNGIQVGFLKPWEVIDHTLVISGAVVTGIFIRLFLKQANQISLK